MCRFVAILLRDTNCKGKKVFSKSISSMQLRILEGEGENATYTSLAAVDSKALHLKTIFSSRVLLFRLRRNIDFWTVHCQHFHDNCFPKEIACMLQFRICPTSPRKYFCSYSASFVGKSTMKKIT